MRRPMQKADRQRALSRESVRIRHRGFEAEFENEGFYSFRSNVGFDDQSC
jgi:hypothetical protein